MLTPGYILTDEYGDMIGLTSLEMHVVVQARSMGPAPDITPKGIARAVTLLNTEAA